MGVTPLAPEASASASSATWAYTKIYKTLTKLNYLPLVGVEPTRG